MTQPGQPLPEGKIKKLIHLLLIGLAAAMLTGCGARLMKVMPREETSYAPGAGEALIVFIRPSLTAGRLKAEIVDVTSDDFKLVGLLRGRTQVAYKTPPGALLFMVAGRTPEFVKATVEAGKTYYIVLRAVNIPFVGVKLSFNPVNKAQYATPKFERWIKVSTFLENTPASEDWGRKRTPRFQIMKASGFEKWNSKPHPELTLQDGF